MEHSDVFFEQYLMSSFLAGNRLVEKYIYWRIMNNICIAMNQL